MKKIATLKLLDSVLGKIACKCISSPTPVVSRRVVQKVLIIRPGGIGDAVLLIPAINALKRTYPHAIIDVLAEKRNSAIFTLCSVVNRTFHYDKPAELFAAIRGKYDVVIDTEQWHRLSAVVARLTRAPMAVGYKTNEREKLFTHLVPYSHDDYEVHSFLNLFESIVGHLSVDLGTPFLTIPAETTNKMPSLFKPLENKQTVALFPGGSIKERRWSSDQFHQMARALVERGYGVVVIGGRDDYKAGVEIAEDLENVQNFCGALSLVETAAVLKESALLIAGDSGIMHIGFGLCIKTLSLFGPGIEKKWAPRGPNHVPINKNLGCSPCTRFGYTPKCTRNAECMKKITVDEVYEKAIAMLEG
jgi:lipopolysaccharide heptosyltransferase II